jgi:hypothetical protein
LKKFNRNAEADSIMKKAIPIGTSLQLLMYGAGLNKMKQHREAFDIFKLNYDKNPKADYANLGMVMGYYFLGKKKEAVSAAENGRKVSIDPNWKSHFESLIADLNSGKELFK